MKLGDFQLDIASDGSFWLDGGGMFGFVPKVLWQRWATPDENNRIELGLNSLLVRTPDANVLIEAGMGRKLDEKAQRIYTVSNAADLPKSLAELGVAPAEIDVVVLTHLHFDHAGWCTRRTDAGGVEPTFPRARVVVQAAELDDARCPCDLTAGAFMPDDFEPIAAAGRLGAIQGEAEVAPGVRVLPTGGHTRGHQAVVIESAGETCLFIGDIAPTAAHLKPAYVMAYDNFPLDVSAVRKELLGKAHDEGWIVAFPHERHAPLARLAKDERGRLVADAVRGA